MGHLMWQLFITVCCRCAYFKDHTKYKTITKRKLDNLINYKWDMKQSSTLSCPWGILSVHLSEIYKMRVCSLSLNVSIFHSILVLYQKYRSVSKVLITETSQSLQACIVIVGWGIIIICFPHEWKVMTNLRNNKIIYFSDYPEKKCHMNTPSEYCCSRCSNNYKKLSLLQWRQ